MTTPAHRPGALRIVKETPELAYRAMKKNMEVEPHIVCGGNPGNPHITAYNRNGFVPVEIGPTSDTLDFAYDDWCVAQMAKYLGNASEYEYFLRRSASWRNVFDRRTGYVTPRRNDGRFISGSPFSVKHLIEGDEGQMGAWFVNSALGLFEMNGGTSSDLRVDLTSPLFSEIRIKLDTRYYPGSEFVIEAHGNSDKNVYIESMRLNGTELKNPFISFRDITAGGKLDLFMGRVPGSTVSATRPRE